MRPIKLTMTAFGPFATTEIIEFDKLGDNPLFLINGPTGSGKTTILDGICFALYGSTTGNERDARQMRCDHSAPDTLTEVELIFSLNERRYRITRQPDQEKPKTRGEGFTNHGASAELLHIGADGAEQLLVARKVGEANETIQTLTGLNADQFRQVMVLPQGKFRELLMANSRDREAIFSQLFQTHIYKRIEDHLKDQAGTIRKEVEAQRNQQKGILEAADVDNSDALENELVQLQPVHAAAKAAKLAATAAQQQANDELKAAQQLVADFTRLAESENKLKTLEARKPLIDAKRAEQALAEEANRLNPLFRDVERCTKQLSLATTRWQQAQAEQGTKAALLKQADKALEQAVQREPQLDAAKQHLTTLETYRQRVTQLETARVNKQQATNALAKAKAALLKAQTDADAINAKRNQAEQEQQTLATAVQALGGKQLALKTLAYQLGLKHEQVKLAQQVTQSETALLKQQGVFDSATRASTQEAKNTTQVEIAWHQGQAALLAAELEDAQPCPVCGSTDHPQPAVSIDAIPTEQDLNQARTQASDARDLLTKAGHALEKLKTGLEHLGTQLTGTEQKLGAVAEQPLKAVQADHDALEKEVAQLSQQQQRQERLASEIQQLKQGETAAAQALAASNDKHAEAKTGSATAEQQVQNAEQELPDAYRAAGALEAAITAGETAKAALALAISTAREQHKTATAISKAADATLHSADQAKGDAVDAQAKALEAWHDTLRTSNFEDEKQFQLALFDDATLAGLKAQISAYETQCNREKGAVAAQKNALQGKSKPELDTLQGKLAETTEASQAAETAFQEIDKRYSRLVDTRNKLHRALEQTANLEKRYALIGTLADVANGNTGNKISLQRFVLSVLLDDVLLVASTRLKMMSKDRYQLLRNQDRAKGGGASGLDLVVEDAYTGNQRPVATLSGGESFMAALSLALGLSDIVQAYAGGIRLDTLFIDEGFGSLDPESLDLAINTLVDLQATGRMVGIISHVPELKEWMNVRLDVIPDRGGSHTRAVLP